eukprot:753086-Hanusia_phi.AAC.6
MRFFVLIGRRIFFHKVFFLATFVWASTTPISLSEGNLMFLQSSKQQLSHEAYGSSAQMKETMIARLRLRGGLEESGIEHEASKDANSSIPAWKRSILVTGGCGFMGSHLVDRLVLKYPQYLVVVLDILDECSSTHHLSNVKNRPNFVFVHGDVS